MKLHILGICGTFMGGVAALAREQGHAVEGSDANVYPPMSTQLETARHRAVLRAIDADNIAADYRRGRGRQCALARQSGGRARARCSSCTTPPARNGCANNVLPGRDTLAVAGTHGKTTTTSILAFLLEAAGRDPGFLVGGVPENFGVSARLGSGSEFVVEADEYDTAFFDKRSKFVHYRPLVAILNNLEYDHADIFPDLAAIQRQFHHLVRIVPGSGRLIVNGEDDALAEVLAMGCWTPVERFGHRWRCRVAGAHWCSDDGSAFAAACIAAQESASVRWPMLGRHNVHERAGRAGRLRTRLVSMSAAVIPALADFVSVKRRLEVHRRARAASPCTTISPITRPRFATTLEGLRAQVGDRAHRGGDGAAQQFDAPGRACRRSWRRRWTAPMPWCSCSARNCRGMPARWCRRCAAQGETVADCRCADRRAARHRAQPGDHVVFMSNGGFDGAPRRMLALLK